MAGGARDGLARSIQTLFDGGAAAGLTDAQLLDRFLDRGGEAAEAAFEALVVRHGPMVLDVCRNVLGATHDAEDAFQATFLVLACKARSVRRREAVASWLFGVARRVATRARSEAARRRAHERRAAEVSTVETGPAEGPQDFTALTEEIEKLPARYREAVVLCYLQGVTYEAAARRLRCPLGTLSVRLKRARERLRAGLTRRGVAEPAGLFAAAGVPRASVPTQLVASTVRAACSAPGKLAAAGTASAAAVTLTQGVLRSMTIHKLKVAAAALAPLILGAGFWAWRASSRADDPGPAPNRQAAAPAPRPKKEAARGFRMVGTVRDEATGEPVAGASLDVLIGSSGEDHRSATRTARSGPDGGFSIDLPVGSARAWSLTPPVGYWHPSDDNDFETFTVSADAPAFRKDYAVRRGTVWDFRVTRGSKPVPSPGFVTGNAGGSYFRADLDDRGRARLTLPNEGNTLRGQALKGLTVTDAAPFNLEWESGFRPDAVASVSNLGGTPPKYRLTDRGGKTATIAVRGPGKGRVEPVLDAGALVVEVALPVTDPASVGDLAGTVVDASGKPIAGAKVALVLIGENSNSIVMPDARATTDERGAFRLRSIDRPLPDKPPVTIQLSVTKDGYAGVDTKEIAFHPPVGDTPQVVAPVTLAPGFSVTGTVVGPGGKPLAGVWVTPSGSFASRTRFTKTDDAGRFTVRDQSKGIVRLNFHYGKLGGDGTFVAGPNPEPQTVTLRPLPEPAPRNARADAAKAAPPKPAVPTGAAAPEWEAGAWSDGKTRTLADYHGKVVFLDFWGVWCGPCLHALPTIETLRARYEPRGVVFLSLHTPGESEKAVRKVLETKKSNLVFAFDRDRNGDDRNGATAARYGVGGYPTVVVIDRAGKVAFRSDDPALMPVYEAALKEMNIDPKTVDEEQAARLIERMLDRAVDRVLNPPSR